MSSAVAEQSGNGQGQKIRQWLIGSGVMLLAICGFVTQIAGFGKLVRDEWQSLGRTVVVFLAVAIPAVLIHIWRHRKIGTLLDGLGNQQAKKYHVYPRMLRRLAS